MAAQVEVVKRGFRVQGLVFQVVQFRVSGFGFRIWVLEFAGFRV